MQLIFPEYEHFKKKHCSNKRKEYMIKNSWFNFHPGEIRPVLKTIRKLIRYCDKWNLTAAAYTHTYAHTTSHPQCGGTNHTPVPRMRAPLNSPQHFRFRLSAHTCWSAGTATLEDLNGGSGPGCTGGEGPGGRERVVVSCSTWDVGNGTLDMGHGTWDIEQRTSVKGSTRAAPVK